MSLRRSIAPPAIDSQKGMNAADVLQKNTASGRAARTLSRSRRDRQRPTSSR